MTGEGIGEQKMMREKKQGGVIVIAELFLSFPIKFWGWFRHTGTVQVPLPFPRAVRDRRPTGQSPHTRPCVM